MLKALFKFWVMQCAALFCDLKKKKTLEEKYMISIAHMLSLY